MQAPDPCTPTDCLTTHRATTNDPDELGEAEGSPRARQPRQAGAIAELAAGYGSRQPRRRVSQAEAHMDRPWSIGAGGEVFFLSEPHASPIRVESIAHSLAGINRFNGHGRHRGPTADGRIYSVLEHSVIVGQIAFHLTLQKYADRPGKLGFANRARGLGALHDAHEAYTGDMNYSAKVLLRRTTTAWDDFEHAWEAIVREYFLGPTWDQQWQAYAEIVKRADTIALLAERRVLLPAGPRYPHEETLSRQDLDYARDLAPSLAAPFGPSLHATWLAQLTDAGIDLEGYQHAMTCGAGVAP